MGPMYPSCVLLITELMPGDLHTGAIGFLACVGVVGSAIMPFITGALSEAVSRLSHWNIACAGRELMV